MDSNANAAAKLQQRPPQQADAADELPAPPEEGSHRRQITITGARLRAIAALALFSDYFRIVGKSLADSARDAAHEDDDKLLALWWRVPALVALAYAVVAALIWFIGRRPQRDDVDDVEGRWEGRVKVAAQILAYAIINVVIVYCSASMIPLALLVFMWVKSRDKVYMMKVREEESEERSNQLGYQV